MKTIKTMQETTTTAKNNVFPPKNKAYTKFNLILSAVTLTPLLATGLLNLLVDPYGIIKSPMIVGLNVLKPAQDNQTRLLKSAEIIQFKPQRLILGSSTVILGLDPKNDNLQVDENLAFYNAGLTGAYISEVRKYLEHALLNQSQIDQVILGLDFFMFNKTKQGLVNDEQDLLNKTQIPLWKKLETLFSINTLEKSIETVETNLKTPESTPYYSLGMRNEINLEQLTKTTDTAKIFQTQIQKYLSGFYKNYQLSQEDLAQLKSIVDLCREKQIKLTVLISPVHVSQMEAIRQAGLWDEFEQWKEAVSQITPVWDFSDYNSITEEPFQQNMKYFHDSVHYSQETGDLILERIFSNSTKPTISNFGFLLLPNQNHQEYFKSIRERQNQWVYLNPKLVEMVKKIATNVN